MPLPKSQAIVPSSGQLFISESRIWWRNLKPWDISALFLKHNWLCTMTHAVLMVSILAKIKVMVQYLQKVLILLLTTWMKAQWCIICLTRGHSFTSFRDGHYLVLLGNEASDLQRAKRYWLLLKLRTALLFWFCLANLPAIRNCFYSVMYTVQKLVPYCHK